MSIRLVDSRKAKGRKQFNSLGEGDAFVYKGLLYIVKNGVAGNQIPCLLVTGSSVTSSVFGIENYEQTTPVDVVMTVKDQE